MEQNIPLECIKCTPCTEIYSSGEGWSVILYREETTGKKFRATGNDLPGTRNMTVALYGNWVVSGRDHTKQFSVVYYDIPKQTSENGVMAYVKTLKCGIGRKKAQKIYEKFGEKTWDVIENSPQDLLDVAGISENTVQNLIEARMQTTQLRELISLCADAGVDISSAVLRNIIKDYGDNTMAAITENPYILNGAGYRVSFEKTDAIAEKLGFPKNFRPRLEAGLNTVLISAEINGNTCLPKTDITVSGKVYKGILSLMAKYLNCSENDCKEIIIDQYRKGKIRTSGGYIFRAETYEKERSVVQNIYRLLTAEHREISHLDNIIAEFEDKTFKLAECQKAAVKMVFLSLVSVITGGPGTGKTTVIKHILNALEQVYGESADPVLLAPTGKAARRMAETTGYEASTIHSAVGYRGDDIPILSDSYLEGNFFIIDESSMIDLSIVSELLKRIETGSRVVFVGDADQLPSVGAGNVLKDIIDSGVVPMTKLDVIFRQKEDNPIIINAAKMNRGDTSLLYTPSFRFYHTETDRETFRKTIELYMNCVGKLGIDNVILLNPQRQNTELSVGAFNKALQELIHKQEQVPGNELNEGKLSVRIGSTEYMEGDRVMQLKNSDGARNGDVGVIRRIVKVPDEDDPQKSSYKVFIEFGEEEQLQEYSAERMRELDLAYATTVHKAQGSEYQCVIEVVSNSHPTMCRRQIVYTGITRSRNYVFLVGQKSALEKAILYGEPDLRHTGLKKGLQEHLH